MASTNHFLLTPRSTLAEVLDTNLIGTFLLAREAAKLMQKNRWGRIVNFTSITVPLRLAGEATYVASKAAVEALTAVLANELAGFGITVSSEILLTLSTSLSVARVTSLQDKLFIWGA